MENELDVGIVAICEPHFHNPRMQSICLTARTNERELVCELKALRLADSWFDIENPKNLVTAFDDHTAVAYNFSQELYKRRRTLKSRYREMDVIASGFIAILSIETCETWRGRKVGLRMLKYLQCLHAGMQWFVGLEAAPQGIEFHDKHYRAQQKRLINYYASDNVLDLREIAPKSSPGLMTALW